MVYGRVVCKNPAVAATCGWKTGATKKKRERSVALGNGIVHGELLEKRLEVQGLENSCPVRAVAADRLGLTLENPHALHFALCTLHFARRLRSFQDKGQRWLLRAN